MIQALQCVSDSISLLVFEGVCVHWSAKKSPSAIFSCFFFGATKPQSVSRCAHHPIRPRPIVLTAYFATCLLCPARPPAHSLYLPMIAVEVPVKRLLRSTVICPEASTSWFGSYSVEMSA